MTIAFVSGASGFVGTALTAELKARGIAVRLPPAPAGGQGLLHLPGAELARCLEGVDLVYHLAGLAHAAVGRANRAELFAVNRDLTLKMHRAAGEAGVSAFMWLSSIKVLGEVAATPLPPSAEHAPQGNYAESKAETERKLLQASPNFDMQLMIVRPPLVYGPSVKGNFARLLRLCASSWPLPVAGAVGLRSMLGLDNLVDFLICLADASGPPQILHVRDDEEWRVTDLVRELRRIGGLPNRQFCLPARVAAALAHPIGLSKLVSSLFDPLRVDMGPSQSALGWHPRFSARPLMQKTWRWMVSGS